jgi:hypothetical protein
MVQGEQKYYLLVRTDETSDHWRYLGANGNLVTRIDSARPFTEERAKFARELLQQVALFDVIAVPTNMAVRKL